MQRIFLKKLYNTVLIAGSFCLLSVFGGPSLAAFKDQSRIPSIGKSKPALKSPDTLLPNDLLDATPDTPPLQPQNPGNEEPITPLDPYDINDIPALIKLDLTVDIAKRAIDAFVDVGSRYDDKGLYDYPTLEEFVEKTDSGKQLQADVKKYGFKDIVDWNTAIMNVSFAYGAILEDQEQDIRAQIDAVRQDKSLRSDKKLRIIASLTALIPSKENVEIIKKLRDIPAYQEKLLRLEAFE